MKWWLLFVSDLGVLVCILRAVFDARAAQPVRAAHQPYAGVDKRTWMSAEANGWIVAACLCAFLAFFAVTLPA